MMVALKQRPSQIFVDVTGKFMVWHQYLFNLVDLFLNSDIFAIASPVIVNVAPTTSVSNISAHSTVLSREWPQVAVTATRFATIAASPSLHVSVAVTAVRMTTSEPASQPKMLVEKIEKAQELSKSLCPMYKYYCEIFPVRKPLFSTTLCNNSSTVHRFCEFISFKRLCVLLRGNVERYLASNGHGGDIVTTEESRLYIPLPFTPEPEEAPSA